MSRVYSTGAANAYPCNCIGPQNGQPLCPCMMRGVSQRDGRWIMPERDLGMDTLRGVLDGVTALEERFAAEVGPRRYATFRRVLEELGQAGEAGDRP